MAAASGDEAFVMLTLFPGTALFLFFILFVVSIVGGRLIDVIVKKFNIATKSDCHELVVHSSEKTFKHFFREHVFGHIIKKHLWKIAIWTFGALLFAEGLIRFSILLTSSVVQDGHGMLPLLSYSVEDSVKIKAFNFSFGIILGLIVFVFGY